MLKAKLFSQALVQRASFSEAREEPVESGQGIVSTEPPKLRCGCPRLAAITHHLHMGLGNLSLAKTSRTSVYRRSSLFSVAKVFWLSVHQAIFSSCRTLHLSTAKKACNPTAFSTSCRALGLMAWGALQGATECYGLNVGVTHSPKFKGLGPNLNSLWELIRLRWITREEPPWWD